MALDIPALNLKILGDLAGLKSEMDSGKKILKEFQSVAGDSKGLDNLNSKLDKTVKSLEAYAVAQSKVSAATRISLDQLDKRASALAGGASVFTATMGSGYLPGAGSSQQMISRLTAFSQAENQRRDSILESAMMDRARSMTAIMTRSSLGGTVNPMTARLSAFLQGERDKILGINFPTTGGGGKGRGGVGGEGGLFDAFRESSGGLFGRLAFGTLAFEGMRTGFTDVVEGITQQIKTQMMGYGELMTGLINGLKIVTESVFQGMIQGIEGIATGIEQGFKKALHGDLLGGALQGLGTAVGGSLKGFATSIGGVFTGVGGSVGHAIQALGSIVAGGIESFGKEVGGLFKVAGAIGGIGAALTGVGIPAAAGIVGGGQLLGGLTESGTQIAGTIAKLEHEIMGKIVGAVAPAIGDITKEVLNASAQGMQAVFHLASGIAETVTTAGMHMERMQRIVQVLVGDAAKGTSIFEGIQNLSTTTPYSLHALQDIGEELLSMGLSSEHLVETLKALGNVASGDSDKFRKLAIIYGDIMEGGKLTQFRLRELAKVGVTASEIAKTMGISIPQFQQRLGAGIPGDALTETINRLISPGGRFFGQSSQQLQTVEGQWKRFNNVIDLSVGKMGMAFNKSLDLSGGLKGISDWITTIIPDMEVFGSKLGTFVGEMAGYIKSILGVIAQDMQLPNMKLPSAAVVFDSIMNGLRDFVVGLAKVADYASSMIDTLKEVFAKVFSSIASFLYSIDLNDIKFGGFMGIGQVSLPTLLGMSPKSVTGVHTGIEAIADLFSNSSRFLQNPGGFGGFQWGPLNTIAGRMTQASGGGMATQALGWFNRIFAANNQAIQAQAPQLAGGVGSAFNTSISSKDQLLPLRGGFSTRASDFLRDFQGKIDKGGLTPADKFIHDFAAFRELTEGPGLIRQGMAGSGFPGIKALQAASAFKSPFKGDQKANALMTLFDEGQKQFGDMSNKLPPAAMFGSTEAMDTIIKTQVDNKSVFEQMQATLAGILEAANAQKKYAQDSAEGFDRLPKDLKDAIGALIEERRID